MIWEFFNCTEELLGRTVGVFKKLFGRPGWLGEGARKPRLILGKAGDGGVFYGVSVLDAQQSHT